MNMHTLSVVDAGTVHTLWTVTLVWPASGTASALSAHIAPDMPVEIGRGPSQEVRREEALWRMDVVDGRVSSRHVRLVHTGLHVELEDLGSKNGVKVRGVQQLRTPLVSGDVVELGGCFLVVRQHPEGEATPPAALAMTVQPALRTRLAGLMRAAPLVPRVVLVGEAGVGKRTLARQLHQFLRPGLPFISVHCGTLTRTDEPTSGNVPRSTAVAFDVLQSHWAAAGRGTVLLEEMGDLPAPAQAAILRILSQEQGPLVLATTHRDPGGAVQDGALRRDVAAALLGLVLDVPPLRERVEDVGVALASVQASMDARAPSLEAVRALLAHPWPHNFTELIQTLRAAFAVAGNAPLDVGHLGGALQRPGLPSAPLDPGLSAEDTERRARLVELLEEHGGNISAVARSMGKARMQIQRWIKRYGLLPAGKRI